MNTQDTIGKLIDATQQRDAVHIAVAPVLAGERLDPGEKVFFKLNDTTTAWAHSEKAAVGIVDPFLSASVYSGERFWLFLYPNTITSLRHDWTHPEFKHETKDSSERWLRDFIAGASYGENDGQYEEVLAAAVRNTDYEYLCLGFEIHGEIPQDFWHHIEVVTGKKTQARPNRFTCSC